MRYIAEIIVCLICGLALYFEALDIRSQDIRSFAKNYVSFRLKEVVSCSVIEFARTISSANERHYSNDDLQQ